MTTNQNGQNDHQPRGKDVEIPAPRRQEIDLRPKGHITGRDDDADR